MEMLIVMEYLWFLLPAAFLAAAVLITAYICFRIAFFVKPEDKIPSEEYPIPEGRIYEPFREQMVAWIKEVRALPHEDMTITSFDGLKLRGRYYEFAPGAPMEIMFHGYRGNAERDMCGGVQRCFALGRSALIVDLRGCGSSEGNVISFGIHEVRDCLAWLDHAIRRFGPDVKIVTQCGCAGDISPRILHYQKAQMRRMKLKYGMEYDIAKVVRDNPDGINKSMSERKDIAERIVQGAKEVYGWARKEIYTQVPVDHEAKELQLKRRMITDEEIQKLRDDFDKEMDAAIARAQQADEISVEEIYDYLYV